MQAGVRTLSVRAGVEAVFWTCIVLMEVAYAGAIGVGLMSQVLVLLLHRGYHEFDIHWGVIAQTGWDNWTAMWLTDRLCRSCGARLSLWQHIR